MSAEHRLEIGEARDTAPVTAESAIASVESFRRQQDPRLVGVIKELDTVLEAQLPSLAREEIQHSLSMFRYTETLPSGEQHERLLIVGPVRLGLGVTAEASDDRRSEAGRLESISVTKYHAADRAIIGHTVFVKNDQELVRVSDVSNDLFQTTTMVIDFGPVEYGDTEKINIERPDIYGYNHGAFTAIDSQRLLQMGASYDGTSGLWYSGNKRDGKPFDILSHAESIVSALKEAEYLGSRPMDFDFKG